MTDSLVRLAARVRRALGDEALPDGGADCRCDPSFVDPPGEDRTVLSVDADDCPGDGDLASSPGCLEAVVVALSRRDADVVRTRSGGLERTYEGGAAGLLLAAGRFVERVAFHDERLAARAARDPIGAAREATGRAGPVATVAAETGLAEGAALFDSPDGALTASIAPTVARARVAAPPAAGKLIDAVALPTGAVARLYDTPSGRRYHLRPPFRDLPDDALATLATAACHLATGLVDGGDRAPGRAVRAVATRDDPVDDLSRLLRRHTRGYGVLEHLVADPRVSDVFATAPIVDNPLRVEVDGQRLPTNVRLTPDGAAALASRVRRASGSAFSRADPTIDAVIDVRGERVRVAGVTAPASDGFGFAFRAHGDDAWTLPGLIANGTLSAAGAAFLSLAVERAVAGLVAGTRGAGKTTLLGALLWELPADTRSVLIEDTPELPAARLRGCGRDVQRLVVDPGDGPSPSPEEALRAALRLGDGALIVGEVRGAEAATLYEAMRVGASANAVLGTIHADGGEGVRERVVSDLGVALSSFAATDLVVTCRADPSRHVARVEEVRRTDEGVSFEALFAHDGDALASTGCIERGNSHLLASLADPSESYADLRDELARRERRLSALASTDQTAPEERSAADSPAGSRRGVHGSDRDRRAVRDAVGDHADAVEEVR